MRKSNIIVAIATTAIVAMAMHSQKYMEYVISAIKHLILKSPYFH